MDISLQMGPIGEHAGGRGSVYQGLIDEGQPWKQSISLYGSTIRGTWREAPLLRTLKGM